MPAQAAEAVQRRGPAIRANVSGQTIGLVHGHIEHAAALIFHRQKLARVTFQLPLHESAKAADPVIDVDDIVASQQVGI
jgi:hypothetical protein